MTSIILSLVLTFFGSRWINFLYKLPTAPLSFPNEIQSRARFRIPLLAIILLVTFNNVAQVQTPLQIYLMAANFFLALIIFTDFEQYVIFDRMLLPLAGVGILAVIHLDLPVADRFAAALIGGGIFFLIAMITHGGIGGGDVKLIFVLGIWLGLENLLSVVIMACIVGGIVAAALILFRQKNRQSYFAYGPYFALATMYILYYAKGL